MQFIRAIMNKSRIDQNVCAHIIYVRNIFKMTFGEQGSLLTDFFFLSHTDEDA